MQVGVANRESRNGSKEEPEGLEIAILWPFVRTGVYLLDNKPSTRPPSAAVPKGFGDDDLTFAGQGCGNHGHLLRGVRFGKIENGSFFVEGQARTGQQKRATHSELTFLLRMLFFRTN
jgi:hypothetical protein